MLPIDVTFDTGKETEKAWKHRTCLKIIIVVNIVEVRRTNSRKENNFVYRARDNA